MKRPAMPSGPAVLSAIAASLVCVPATHGQSVPVDTAGLGDGPRSRMHMLLERTIFRVDVLTLDLRFGSEAAARLEGLLAAGPDGPGDRADGLADSVAAVALDARDVYARIEFRRNLDLKRFLEGIRENLRRAVRSGIVSVEDYRSIAGDLPEWYAPLAGRGIRQGDRMHHRIRGDSLRTVYVGRDGERLLDQVDIGPERRLAVLGGYFAPGSDFRDGLVESALRDGEVR